MLEWFYLESGKDEKKAAIKALKYLLFQVAKMGDEKVGGVYLRNSSRFKSLKAVYDDLVKSSVSGLPYAGGINQCDIDMRRQNPALSRNTQNMVMLPDTKAEITATVLMAYLLSSEMNNG